MGEGMNYKRKRPRTASSGYSVDKYRNLKLPSEVSGWVWLNNWPRWWDKIFHTRPHRRRTRVLENAVLQEKLDPDNVAWPLYKKPHSYYW